MILIEHFNAAIERTALCICSCGKTAAMRRQLTSTWTSQADYQSAEITMSDREYLVDGRCNDSNSVAIFIAFRGESLDTMFAQCSAFGAGMLQFLRI